MIAALDDGIARLAGDGDARSADLVTRVLGAHQVSKPALTSLADLYRAARYSTNPMGSGTAEKRPCGVREEALDLRTERVVVHHVRPRRRRS